MPEVSTDREHRLFPQVVVQQAVPRGHDEDSARRPLPDQLVGSHLVLPVRRLHDSSAEGA